MVYVIESLPSSIQPAGGLKGGWSHRKGAAAAAAEAKSKKL